MAYDHAFVDDMELNWPAWDRKKDEEKMAKIVECDAGEGTSRPVRSTRGRRPPRYNLDKTPSSPSSDGESDMNDRIMTHDEVRRYVLGSLIEDIHR